MEINSKIESIYPLTTLQEGMLYQNQVGDSSGEYLVQFVYSTREQIDPQNVANALRILSKKHEMLRAMVAYRTVSRPVMVVLKERMPEFKISNISKSDVAEEQFNHIKSEDVRRGFDLEKDTMLRANLVILPNSEYRLIMTFHHIITDGWSNSIISKDFFDTYNALRRGANAIQLVQNAAFISEKDKSYSGYINWLRQRDHEAGLAYWKELLNGYNSNADITPLGKHTDIDDSVAVIDHAISPSTTAAIEKLAQICGVTLNVVMSAAFGIMLGRYSHTNDVVFGKVVSGRDAPVRNIGSMVGLFINTVPQRVCYTENTTVKQLLSELHTQAAESSVHDYIGLSEIQRELQVGSNLIKTLFTFENYSSGGESSEDWINRSGFKMICGREETNYNTSYVTYKSDVLHIKVMYKPEMFGFEEMATSIDRIIAVLESMATNPTAKVQELSMLLPGEKEKIIKAAAGTSADYPRNSTVVDLFVRQAAATPFAPVLTMKDKSMTYKQLDELSDKLAMQLTAKGAGKGKCVALIATRSMNMLVAIFGILKTGAAYVPIDPKNPVDRTSYILRDCSPVAVVLSGTQYPVSGISTIDMDDPTLLSGYHQPFESLASPDQLSYIIYTSGTTGTPKGVMIKHRSLMHYVSYARQAYLDEDISIPLFTNYCFDLTVTSIFLGTCFGGVLDVIPPEEELNIPEIVNSNKYSLIKMTPMHMKICIEATETQCLTRLKSLILGGEALKTSSTQRMLELYGGHIAIHNEYGPTEATVGCCDYIYKQNDSGLYVSIGKPIANTQVYILNGNTLCGFGIPGELCIAGEGIGVGYLGQEKLTSEHFVVNPFGAGRLYRSGDLACMFPDGTLEYMGRIDDQVKVNGIRIELGEVESIIGRHINATDVRAIVRDQNDEKQLCCYFVAPNVVDIGSLRESLRKVMPEHMIPQYMMQIDYMPLTRNGKLDKLALPEIVQIESEAYIAPNNDVEKAIAVVLCNLLCIDKVSMNDSFFRLGGDSIKAIRVVSKLRSMGYKTTVKEVITSTSIQELANNICQTTNIKTNVNTEVTATCPNDDDEEVSGYTDYTPIIRRSMSYQLKKPDYFNMSFMLSTPAINMNALRATLDELVRHHDMLRCVCRDGRLFIRKADAPNLYDIEVFSLQDCQNYEIEEKIREICNNIQSTISLENGPIVKVAVIQVNSTWHIMMAVHHIAADGVSLRILLEDFEQGYHQYIKHKSIRLDPKTDSFIKWSNSIKEYEGSAALLKEIPYWQERSGKAVTIDFGKSSGSKRIRTSSVQLNEKLTDDIVRNSLASYNLRVNDVMLSILALAVRYATSHSTFSVFLEGHGREPIDRNVFIDRTVGWFTSQYPVVLTTDGDIRNTLITTKEMLRCVPNNGIGYGILAYGHKPQITPFDPKILFNYLGSFSEGSSDESVFALSPYSSGDDTASENIPDDELIINCVVRNGKLEVMATYNESNISCNTVERILAVFAECAQRVADHCTAMTTTIPTGSDLGFTDMPAAVFNRICSQIDITNVEKVFRLSNLQQGMLYHKLVDEKDSSYFVQDVMKLEPQYSSLDLISTAFNCLSSRFETLRTCIVYEGLDEPYQVILKNKEVCVDCYDLCAEESPTDAFARLCRQDIERGFDFVKGPLVRVTVVNMPDGMYMIWSIHHIIVDGWSSTILFETCKNILRRLKDGETPKNLCDSFKMEESGKNQFSDYIAWLEMHDKTVDMAFWDEMLEGYEGVVTIKPYGYMLSQRGTANLSISATKKRTDMLKSLCTQTKITMNTLVETGLGILLQRFNNTNDVVFGKVVSGRNPDVRDIDSMVGLFINTIPQRIRCENNITISELLTMVQKQSAEAIDHDTVGLADIQSRSAVGKNLVNIILAFENAGIDESVGTVDNVFTMVSSREETNYEISFVAYEEDDALKLGAIYNMGKFTEQDVKLILERLLSILREMSDMPNSQVYDIGYINKNETTMILDGFNRTAVDYPRNKCITELFEKQVAEHPLKNAIVFEEDQLTYAELNNRANSIAYRLIKMGVTHNDRVAIFAERCVESIVGICGIIKAGAAYVPIDTSYPEERINGILEDCHPRVVITIGKRAVDSHYQVLNIDKCLSWAERAPNLQIIANHDDPAYVIYTSGTTGKPKGVVVTHRNVIKLVKGADYTKLDRSTRVLQTGQMAFDASTFEIWGCLLNGGLLHLISEATLLNTKKLKEYIINERINTMFITTALFNQLIFDDITIFDSLDHLMFGGEITSEECVSRLRAHNKRLDLRNVYGPTETTTFATHYIVDCDKEKTPIGRPISNTQIYIINNNKLCGVGTPGEICIAGDGVANGYFNQPQMTNSKFVDNPCGDGKLYRSGDVARWLPDGNIEYIERMDNQVKVRGFRIELGDIQNALRTVNGIKDAVIIVRAEDSGAKELCAYIVSDSVVSIPELKTTLGTMLPHYMIPAYIMQIDKIPLNSNGKINKNMLPTISTNSGVAYTAPRTEAERIICEIFASVLAAERVGIDDDFFMLGGHSLRATRVLNQIDERLGVRLSLKELFGNSTVRSLAKVVTGTDVYHYTAIPKAVSKKYYPMTSTQRRMFMLWQMDKKSVAYNMPLLLHIEGNISEKRVRNVLKTMILRHEILRTKFLSVGDSLVQQICSSGKENFEYTTDLITDNETLFKSLIRPFALDEAELVRVRLIKRPNGHLMFVDMHHIVADGMSIGTFMNEFSALYNGDQLEPIKLQFKDYSEWLLTCDQTVHRDYWHKVMSDEIPVLDMPLDFKRPQRQSHNGNTINIRTPKKLRDDLAAFAKQYSATEYMVFLSALMVLLSKYSRQEDIIVGTTISGRTHKDTEKMMGMFVNTLAMRGYPAADKTCAQFVKETVQNCLKAYEHQEYPFDELVESLNVKRDISRNPLFDVMLVYQNNETARYNLKGLRTEPVLGQQSIAKFDLTFIISDSPDGYEISLEYCTDLFLHATVQGVAEKLLYIIEQMIASPTAILGSLSTVPEYERQTIMCSFNSPCNPSFSATTIQELFERQVAHNPDAIALILGDQSMSYGELNRKANILANRICADGIGPNQIVALFTERSFEMIIAMLGVLKAGAAYLPIDPSYPQSRIDFILADSNAKAIIAYKAKPSTELPLYDLTDSKLLTNGSNLNPKSRSHAEDIAYCIYTSGTSGHPKGVLVTHKGVCNLASYFCKDFGITTADRVLQFANYVFDASVWEMSMALLCGAILVLTPKELVLDTDEFEEYFDAKRVTVATLPPNYFLNLKRISPRLLITAGSESSDKVLKKIGSATRYVNAYGPTETTVCATWWEYDRIKHIGMSVPIGSAIPNTQVYILAGNDLCGVGVPGELCIAGVGVAVGYLNRSELTSAKFIKNPFGEGMMYRSGDLARWNADGEIIFMGRIDQQVKIRGYRIEPEEIESEIREIYGIKAATVFADGDGNGEKVIYAYYVADEDIAPSEVKAHLKQRMPAYMIPSVIIRVDNIPMNRSGKVDRTMLPRHTEEVTSERVQPNTHIEKEIATIFKEVLNVDSVSMDDSFFDLGGDSMRAIALVNRIKAKGYFISVTDIMSAPTLQSICQLVSVENVDITANEEGMTAFSKYDDVVKYIDVQYDRFSDSIVSSGEDIIYPFTPVQRIMIFSGALVMGAAFKIDFDVDVTRLKRSFISLINTQGMLRTAVCKKNMKMQNKQFKPITDAEIPFVDVTSLSEEEKSKLDRYLRNLAENRYKRLKKSMYNRILYQIIVLKYSDDNWMIYLPFNHLFFDMLSADIFMTSLKRIYQNNGQPTGEQINQYSEYAQCILDGPRNIDYDGMRKLLLVDERYETIGVLDKVLKKNIVGVNFTIDIRDADIQLNEENLWNLSFFIFNRLCLFETKLERFPFTTVIAQRKYGNKSFYNTIGCLADNISMYDTRDNLINYRFINEFMDRMGEHVVNNIGMQYGISNWMTYPSTGFEDAKRLGREMLTKLSKFNMPVFDHMGMIDLVKSETTGDDGCGNVSEFKKSIASMLNVASIGCAGRTFYVAAFCTKGTGKAMHDYVQTEMDEYIKKLVAQQRRTESIVH